MSARQSACRRAAGPPGLCGGTCDHLQSPFQSPFHKRVAACCRAIHLVECLLVLCLGHWALASLVHCRSHQPHPAFPGTMHSASAIDCFFAQAAGSSLAPNLRPGTAGLNLILEVAAAIWLVQGSTWLTERISTAKYGPKYDQYKQTTSRLIPWFPSAPPQRAKKRTTASAAPDEVPRPAPAASGAAPVEAASPAPGPTPVSRRRAARTPRPTSAAEAEAETPAVHTRSRLRTKAAAA